MNGDQFEQQMCQPIVNFDSRIWLGVNQPQVINYFRWLQADATSCVLNGWCYWMLRKSSETARKARTLLDSQTLAFKYAKASRDASKANNRLITAFI